MFLYWLALANIKKSPAEKKLISRVPRFNLRDEV